MSDSTHIEWSDATWNPVSGCTRVFAVMALAPQHTFQILTKRHGRMRSLLSSDAVKVATMDAAWDLRPGPLLTRWPLPNVWLGVSAEDQQRANLRIPALLNTPAAIRFISAEPLLGPIDLRETFARMPAPRFDGDELHVRDVLHWVIVGGESGRGARPMDPEWVRLLRDQCDAAGVAFFFKQWGGWAPESLAESEVDVYLDAATGEGTYYAHCHRPGVERMVRVGKKAAGRLLDGREHNDMPQAVTA